MKLREVSDATFEAEVLKSEVPVLVDFWASWCGPCKMLAPILEQAADHYGDALRIVKLNTEKNSVVPTQYSIRSLPTLILFEKGEMVDAMIGVRPPDQIKSMIDRVVKPGPIRRLMRKLKSND